MKKILLIITLLIASLHSLADDHPQYLEVSVGISNVSFTETETIVVDDTGTRADPQSGTVAIPSLDFKYKIKSGDKIDYFVRATAPLTSTSGDTYFSTATGLNFYFDAGVAKTEYNQDGTFIKLTPKLRYYAGVELGLGYLVFETPEVRRNDVLFNIGAHAGAKYTFNDKWSFRAAVHGARGAGSNTNTTVIQIFGGVGYSF